MTTIQTPTDPAAPASPGFWQSIFDFLAQFGVLAQVLGIIIGAIALRVLLHFVIRRVVARVVSGVKKRQNVDDTQALTSSPLAAVRIVQRTRTLGSVLNNVVSVIIVIVALLLIVTAIDPNILGSFAIITAALGAGLGFGAQNIVKDVLNGLFMVAEDQLGVGDVVDLGPATGVVEGVGIRITQIRSVDGTLWFVRNGEILRVGNKSLGWARAIVDVAVKHSADIDQVQEAMARAGSELWNSPAWKSRVVEEPEVWGVESMTADAIVLRIVAKTRTSAKDDVARELRARLKRALDAEGIETMSATALLADEGAAAPGEPAAAVRRVTPVAKAARARPATPRKTPPEETE